jgi:hypothetical protein
MHKVRNEISRIMNETENLKEHVKKIKGKIPPKIANKTKIDEKLQGVINHLEQLKQKLSDLLEKKFENAIEGMQHAKGLWEEFNKVKKESHEMETEE